MPELQRGWEERSLSNEMFRLVVLTHICDHFLRRRQLPVERLMPWLGERRRILEGDAKLEMPEIRAPDPLGDVQHFGVRIDADPAVVVVADGIDDERVAVPFADRMSNPAGIRVRWV